MHIMMIREFILNNVNAKKKICNGKWLSFRPQNPMYINDNGKNNNSWSISISTNNGYDDSNSDSTQ